MCMVPSYQTGVRIGRQLKRWEDPEPGPLFPSVWILFLKPTRKSNFRVVVFAVFFENSFVFSRWFSRAGTIDCGKTVSRSLSPLPLLTTIVLRFKSRSLTLSCSINSFEIFPYALGQVEGQAEYLCPSKNMPDALV